MNRVEYPLDEWPAYRIGHSRLRHTQLMNLVQTYLERPPYSCPRVSGTAGSLLTLRMEQFEEPKADKMAMYVGEIANALRGALDSLVWQVLTMHGTTHADGKTMFPIVNDPNEWEKKSRRYLPNAEMPFLDRIEFCQPFSMKTDYPEHPLEILRTLSNTDKHRKSVNLRGAAFPGADANVAFKKEGFHPEFEGWIGNLSNWNQSFEPGPGAVLFEAQVPDYVDTIAMSGAVDLDLAIDVGDAPPLPFRDIPRVIDYVEQVIWYVQDGDEAREHYLRNPKQYNPTLGVH